ncbi:excinuclease ABC subunit A [Candidatus Collierbacteria bacterium RIFOXYA1_FULL_46_24]|nr:MAG: excinuclease ABC subunit A [Candidatus Collierbacteria bacterium RIFOXYA1_FULL_46_24]
MSAIIITGAREHNLKNLDLSIPKDRFVVMTGVSGSGKSSLAFDTIYAEGQRRYVESLSSYARQFLGLMDKPDVDRIDGLSPSISIDQKTVSHNPRSTVGTTTEIYDYLRLLYARVGHPKCPFDKTEITKLSLDEIVQRAQEQLTTQAANHKSAPNVFQILSPVVRNKKGEFKDLFANLRSKGFHDIIVDGQNFNLSDEISLLKANPHTISAVIDTVSVSHADLKNPIFVSNLSSRLTTSFQLALSLSVGLAILKSESQEILYSENFACSVCGHALPEIEPRMFSFNSPLGACEQCKGLGIIEKIDPERIINPRLSYNQGGILPLNRLLLSETWYTRLIQTVAETEGVSLTTPLGQLTDQERQILLYGTGREYEVVGRNLKGKVTSIHEIWDGIIPRLEQRYLETTSEWSRMDLGQYIRQELCPSCLGLKLKKAVLAITIDNLNIIEMTNQPVSDLKVYFEKSLALILSPYELQVAKGIIKEVTTRLNFLDNVGLGYLDLARASRTLSGGEQQRIRLASQIGTGLTGVLYVLDEPSIGLHSRDVDALIASLRHLVALGNTLIVVEHDEETIRSADYVIELGPAAGKDGGHLTAQGTLPEIMANSASLTGQYLSGKQTIPTVINALCQSLGTLKLVGARSHNLKNLTLNLPLGNFIGITGVSGSGKSTLITETLYPTLKYYLDGTWTDTIGAYDRLDGYHYLKSVYLVDQSPIGRTPRSNPATYVGFFDDIRTLFASTQEAKLRGFDKGRFSFNIKGGRCEKCQGAGVIKIEMNFLPAVYVTCDVCQGKRYNQETLQCKYKGQTIYDILNLTIEDGAAFFKNYPKIYKKLQLLVDVGLGYLKIGQGSPTLSGGEAQRIKLASELGKREGNSTLYILDEPTTGLHFHDINKLLTTLRKLVEKGNTVVVIEHNLDVIKNCNYLVDLGPEGGAGGGDILFQGETSSILSLKTSYTAKYLRKHLHE